MVLEVCPLSSGRRLTAAKVGAGCDGAATSAARRFSPPAASGSTRSRAPPAGPLAAPPQSTWATSAATIHGVGGLAVAGWSLARGARGSAAARC
eukprot:7066240-Pyramimonas_sp.AAC.1